MSSQDPPGTNDRLPITDGPIEQGDDSTTTSTTNMLRVIIEDYNSASIDLGRVYNDVIRLVAPRSDETLRTEDVNPSFAPSQWTQLLANHSRQLLSCASRLAELASIGNRSRAVTQSAREASLPALQLPLARHDATDSAMIQYPQFAQLLALIDRLRDVQVRITENIAVLGTVGESLDSRNGTPFAFVQALPGTPVNLSMMANGPVE